MKSTQSVHLFNVKRKWEEDLIKLASLDIIIISTLYGISGFFRVNPISALFATISNSGKINQCKFNTKIWSCNGFLPAYKTNR